MEKPSKKELLEMLDEMIKNYDELPPHAMILPISHYDLQSVLILIKAIFGAEN